MGIKPISTKRFIEFLKAQGLERTKIVDSHHHYDRVDSPLSRNIIIWGNKKNVPLFHIHTNLQTLGISKQEFQELLKDKKIQHIDTIRIKPVSNISFEITYLDQESQNQKCTIEAFSKKAAILRFQMENSSSNLIKIKIKSEG